MKNEKISVNHTKKNKKIDPFKFAQGKIGKYQKMIQSTILAVQKYKLLEIAVKEIRVGENKQVYSNEWADQLSMEDGESLYSQLEEITKKK